MTSYRIASIGGDGVGPEVVAAARAVLDAVAARDAFGIEWLDVVAGGAAIDAYGTAFRPEDLEAVAACDAILLGAVGGGEDAQGRVLVRCRRSSDEGPGALIVSGHGLSTNIIEASIEAYLVAVNKLHGATGASSSAFVGARTTQLP